MLDFLSIELCRLDEVEAERDTARVAEEPNTEHQVDQKRGEEPVSVSEADASDQSSENQLEGRKQESSDRRSSADRSSEGDRKSKKRNRAGSENRGSHAGSRSNSRDASRANSRGSKRPQGSRSGRNDSNSPLTTGLFSALRDKEVPCRVEGCDQTWTWYASQQIKGFGQPPPPRMCDSCLDNFNTLEDREVPCRNSWCNRTWSWKRGAQLHARQNHRGKLRTPSRLCSECFDSERALRDVEVPCKVSGCKNTWTWAKDAQIRHRAWVHRAQAKLAAEQEAAKNTEVQSNAESIDEQSSDGKVVQTGLITEQAEKKVDLSDQVVSIGEETPKTEQSNSVESQASASTASTASTASSEVEAKEQSNQENDDSVNSEIVDTNSEKGKGERVESRAGLDSQSEAQQGTELADVNVGENNPSSALDDPQPNGISAVGSESAEFMATEVSSSINSTESSSEEESNPQARGKGSRRKRSEKQRNVNKRKKIPEGPPEKMCGSCTEALNRMHLIEAPCKVHGCTGTWTWDRASQLRQWIAGGADLDKIPGTPPKRMCDKCREFCRVHHDRQVECGRPGCTKTWTFKTGAQLQASLAGQHHDPSKMCDDCLRGQLFLRDANAKNLPPGAETMPCVVSGCTGTWIYLVGMELAEAASGELPVDRMCDSCRLSRNLEARTLFDVGSSSRDSSDDLSSVEEASKSQNNEEESNSASERDLRIEAQEEPNGESASGKQDSVEVSSISSDSSGDSIASPSE